MVRNSLSNGTILAWFKRSALSDPKLNVAQMAVFVLDRVENCVEKGENAGNQFQQCFQKASLPGLLKPSIV